MKSAGRHISKTVIITVLIIIIVGLSLAISTTLVEPLAHITPKYPKEDIHLVLLKEKLTRSDYNMLFYQTGLGKPAIEELRTQYSDSTERILRFQESFFSNVRYICEKNSPVSREESLVNENGEMVHGTELAPIHNGDILVTKSSHTYGWRNGHSAIIIDAAEGRTLESVVLGTISNVQDISKWTIYPNFMILRLKDATRELTNNIAKKASQLLVDIPYNLTVGIFSPKHADRNEIIGTNCSHLVWQAFRLYDYDLDSDGGMIVTPKDIANSPSLEVVQVFGVNAENIWP